MPAAPLQPPSQDGTSHIDTYMEWKNEWMTLDIKDQGNSAIMVKQLAHNIQLIEKMHLGYSELSVGEGLDLKVLLVECGLKGSCRI